MNPMMSPADKALMILGVIVIVAALVEDPRCLIWLKAQWARTVGAWCAKRRMVGPFAAKRQAKICVDAPDEHSRGIMTTRRDVNTGSWT